MKRKILGIALASVAAAALVSAGVVAIGQHDDAALFVSQSDKELQAAASGEAQREEDQLRLKPRRQLDHLGQQEIAGALLADGAHVDGVGEGVVSTDRLQRLGGETGQKLPGMVHGAAAIGFTKHPGVAGLSVGIHPPQGGQLDMGTPEDGLQGLGSARPRLAGHGLRLGKAPRRRRIGGLEGLVKVAVGGLAVAVALGCADRLPHGTDVHNLPPCRQ